ncbi:MAG: helix-turn-helix domain-containing protein [Desulfobacteraceae bacterium]|nr:helix-turn-helix domain-containing protein [Desulfobacteraceae bacterium]
MKTIRKVRLAYHRGAKSIRQIAKDFHISRNTVKRVL